MRTYELKLDRELGPPELPEPTASLREQRRAARALKVLYPGIEVRLFSSEPFLGDEDRLETRELLI